MRNRNWVFGTNAGLTFASGGPVPFSNKPINTYEGCATISDTSGNLLLYSDGVTVKDGAGTVRASGLLGSQSSTQAAVIVPDPINAKQYYIFTSDGASGGNHHVSCIRINTGTWAPPTSISFVPTPPTVGYSPTEKLVAILHSDQRQFWVLTVVQPATPNTSETGPGLLRVFLVRPSGVQWVGDQPLNQNVSDVGYMKAGKAGRYIALANLWLGNVLVFPFSNFTGQINTSGLINIPVKVPPFNNAGCPYGIEFSPSNQRLYYSTLFPLPIAASPISDGYVFQFSLPSGPSVLVGSHVNDKAGDVSLGALQFGSDGRIYIAQDGEQKLGVIANPNLPGAACGLTFGALPLATGSTCNAGLPNLVRDLF
jgi:hypothetical protein